MTAPGDLLVVGAGGHAKVVVAALVEAGLAAAGAVDDRADAAGSSVLGVPVIGSLEELRRVPRVRAVIAIGDNEIRRAIAERYPAVTWITVVHPRAWVHPSVELGAGTVVLAGAVVQPDAVLGRHCIVNTGATVDHDCVVGPYAHLAPGVHLAGGVRVGEGALLGVGSVVLPGGQVGSWSVVGAGAAVVEPLADNMLAVGVPARSEARR